MKHVLFLLLLVPGIAQAQFVITPGEVANDATVPVRVPVRLVDATDGETAEPGLTISGSECQISINGAAFGNCVGTVTGIGLGNYYFHPDTTEMLLGRSYIFKVEESGTTNVFTGTYRTGLGITNADFYYPQFTAESGTTLTLGTAAIPANDFFNGCELIPHYFSTNAVIESARVQIVDSVDSGETIVVERDVSGLLVGAGGSADKYEISCYQRDVRAALYGKTDFNKTTGDLNLYQPDGSTVKCDRTLSDDGTTATAGSCE